MAAIKPLPRTIADARRLALQAFGTQSSAAAQGDPEPIGVFSVGRAGNRQELDKASLRRHGAAKLTEIHRASVRYTATPFLECAFI